MTKYPLGAAFVNDSFMGIVVESTDRYFTVEWGNPAYSSVTFYYDINTFPKNDTKHSVGSLEILLQNNDVLDEKELLEYLLRH